MNKHINKLYFFIELVTVYVTQILLKQSQMACIPFHILTTYLPHPPPHRHTQPHIPFPHLQTNIPNPLQLWGKCLKFMVINWALCDKFLQFCMMLHMGIQKPPQTKWVGPLVAGLHNIKNGRHLNYIIYALVIPLFIMFSGVRIPFLMYFLCLEVIYIVVYSQNLDLLQKYLTFSVFGN